MNRRLLTPKNDVIYFQWAGHLHGLVHGKNGSGVRSLSLGVA